MSDQKPTAEHQRIFLYDTEKLQEICSEKTIKQGLLYYKENRVTEMDFDQHRLWAYVEGSKVDEPYYVQLSQHNENQARLLVECECTSANEPVCKHAIALLYAYGEQSNQESGALLSAQATAIAERQQKGKTEVNVEHLSGRPDFGKWQAASMVSTTHRPQTYQVYIRSIDKRRNYCSCPDYATNLLGTCKHIEAVVYKLKKSSIHINQVDNANQNTPFVYMSWDEPTPPVIKLWRTTTIEPELNQLLHQYFTTDGVFKEKLPEGFYPFNRQAKEFDQILIGDDVQSYVQKLLDKKNQSLKQQDIEQQITQTNGILPGVRARLYPYQVEGVAFLASKGRALLADDMGLGKTLQAISAALWLKEKEACQRILIICPASLKHQWAREINKFTGLESTIIQGSPEKRITQYRAHHPFLIVNYELVMRDLSLINEVVRPDLVILDEAQRLKNWRTKIASTIKLIYSTYVFVLSGTPMENRLEDLYSLMQVVDGTILGPLWRYFIDYHITDDKGKVLAYRNLSQLRKTIAPVLLRRERSLVRDQLPDKTQIRLDIPLSQKQRELHQAAMSGAANLANIAKRRPLTPSESNRFMSALQQARMACNAAGLVDKETIGSPKLDEVATLLEQLCLDDNQKVVIFSQWERMTAMVESVCNKLELGCIRLHGGVPTAKRGKLIENFYQQDEVSVFISTDAGATGLNLQCASVLINLDVPWNPAVLEQRNARIHRLGQKQNVRLILMVAEDSYEEKVLELVQNKQNLFDNVIEPDATEDTVGVNKKILATLIEEISDETVIDSEKDKNQEKPNDRDEQSSALLEEVKNADQDPINATVKQTVLDTHQLPYQDDVIVRCVAQIQQEIGERLEKISASEGGFLIVVSQFETNDQNLVDEYANDIPLAIVDHRTAQSLANIGHANFDLQSHNETETNVANTILFDASNKKLNTETEPTLLRHAKRKLHSAEVLIEQQCYTDALTLLAESMLMTVANKAELSQAPKLEESSIWLYTEAIPQGLVNHDQVNSILKAMSLAQAPDIPDSLLYEVLEESRMLLHP